MKSRVLAVVLWVVSLACPVWVFASPQQGGQVSDASIKLLFAVDASTATLKHIDGKQYQLIIPFNAVHSIIAFSDRPKRIAFRMTPKVYTNLVFSGNDSFLHNPPNISLDWEDGLQPNSYVVERFKRTEKAVVYHLILMMHSKIPGKRTGKVTLFIDSYTVDSVYCGKCSVTNEPGCWASCLSGESI